MDEYACMDQNHSGFGGHERNCPECRFEGQLTHVSSRPRRAYDVLADLAQDVLYGFQDGVRALARNAVTIATVFAMTAFGSYWAIQIVWAVIDRRHR